MPTGRRLTENELAAAVAAYVNEKTMAAAALTLSKWGTPGIMSVRLERAEQNGVGLLFKRTRGDPRRRPVLTKYGRQWLNERLYFETVNGRWERFEHGISGSGDLMNDTTETGTDRGRANAD